MNPTELVGLLLIIAAIPFFWGGSLGLLRFPDVYTRLHALTKPRSTKSTHRYRRERLLNTLLDAYARAGWKDRIIPRLEDEAEE